VLVRPAVLLYRLTSVTISGTVASQHGSPALIQNTNQIALQYDGDKNYNPSVFVLNRAIMHPLSGFQMLPETNDSKAEVKKLFGLSADRATVPRCCSSRCRDAVATGWRCLLCGRSLSGSPGWAVAAVTLEAGGILALLAASTPRRLPEHPASVSQSTTLSLTANKKWQRRRHADLSFR
jgi:hypothetical protein